MKKTFLLSALALSALTAAAQAIEIPSPCANWSIGAAGGVTTPMVNHPFFKSMRPIVGVNVEKQITPTFGLGVEGLATVNTSSWGGLRSATAFDASYVGAYGTVDLCNLLGGYNGVRPVSVEAIAGVGWGHQYWPSNVRKDNNFMATKAGLNFNFNVSPRLTVTVQPSVMWNMTDANVAQSSAAYDARQAAFNLMAGVQYQIGARDYGSVAVIDNTVVDALNAEVNNLRQQVVAANAQAEKWHMLAHQIDDRLQAVEAQGPVVIETQEVVTETNNYLNTVRYVFYKLGSAVITPDQMPNVEMIAQYMKSHPAATVQIKGYASKDGSDEFNIKLAKERAESVKTALVKKYGIAASRISAEGEGIGNMFDEESWNRVSICTIQNPE